MDRLTLVAGMRKSVWSEQKALQKNQKRRRVVAFFGLLALILVFAYLFVWQRVRTLELAEEHSDRKATVRLLKEKCQSLQYEVEYLSSLENIERIARHDLAMISQQEAQLVKFTLPRAAKPAASAPKPDSVKSAAGKSSVHKSPVNKSTAKKKGSSKGRV